jgi:hypothetical protein
MDAVTQAESQAVAVQQAAAASAAEPDPSDDVPSLQEPGEGEEQDPVSDEVAAGAASGETFTPVEPYNVTVNVPSKYIDEQRTEWVSGFEGAAAQSGIKQASAQTLVDAFTDVATAIPYSIEHEHATPEDAAAEMEKMYGPEQAQTLIRDAQRFFKRLGAPMQKYIDETGLGNDPGVLTVLALGQSRLFNLSPEQAQAEITKITSGKEFFSDDPKTRLLQVAKVQILGRIANRETATVKPPQPPVTPQGKAVAATEAARVEARAEAARMMAEKDGALMNAGHPQHQEAVQKWHALVARL